VPVVAGGEKNLTAEPGDAQSQPSESLPGDQKYTPLDFKPLVQGTGFKILFVYPNSSLRKPHLGLGVLSACALKIGARTDLCDFTVVPPNLWADVFRTKLKNYQPDLVAITVMSPYWQKTIEIISICRELGVAHVVGGSQATVQPEMTIKEADLLVVGEGEGAFMDLVRALALGKSVAGIANTWVKMPDGQVIKSERRHLIEDLDDLPFPDWKLFHDIHFHSLSDSRLAQDINQGEQMFIASLEGSRGCPYACSYCANAARRGAYVGKGKWRREKTPRRIIEELKAFRESFGGLGYVLWVDEIFMTGRKRLQELCEIYKREIGVPFSIKERPELITEAKLKLALDAGLKGIGFGFESGDQYVRQEILNRRTPSDVFERAFALPRKYGIHMSAYAMVGVPGQDEKSLLRTWQELRKIKFDVIQVTFFIPMRGTVLYEECVRRGLYDPKHDCEPEHYGPVIKHDILDDNTIIRYQKMLSAWATVPGIWPAIAFHLGRRWDWACRLVLRTQSQ